MNNRQIVSLLVVLGLVVAGVVYVQSSHKKKTEKEQASEVGQPLIKGFPINDVASVAIKTAQGEVNLVKSEAGWGVQERDAYPANLDFLKELLTKFWELKVTEVQPVGPSQLGRVQLKEPTAEGEETEKGTLITFKKEGGEEVAKLLLGKTIEGAQAQDSPFGFNFGGATGRFVALADKPGTAFMVKEAFSSLQTDVKQWLDKGFIQPAGALARIEVKADPADLSWKVTREKDGAEPAFADKKDSEEIDQDKVKQAGSAFASAYFQDVAPAADKEKSGIETSKRVATVSFFDGFTYSVTVGNKVKPEDENSDYYVGVKVEFANPPAPEATKPVDNETPEQKTAREQADADAKKKWEDDKKTKETRLTAEKKFESRIYLVSKYTVDWFLKDRPYFLKAAAAPAPTGVTPAPATPPPAIKDGSDAGLMPAAPLSPSKPIEAVTPPVSVEIPPMKKEPKPAVEPKKEEVPAERPKEEPAPAAPEAPKQP